MGKGLWGRSCGTCLAKSMFCPNLFRQLPLAPSSSLPRTVHAWPPAKHALPERPSFSYVARLFIYLFYCGIRHPLSYFLSLIKFLRFCFNPSPKNLHLRSMQRDEYKGSIGSNLVAYFTVAILVSLSINIS